jgi:ParB family transcriptional regulator, chromosome partitioning protein
VSRRSGLGRGLSALIPPEPAPARESAFRDIPLSQLRANRLQPRSHFDEEAMSALAASIKELGVLQPVLVREHEDGEYELIAGERRWRAARRAGLQTIPALVQKANDVASLAQALVENLHREDLNPLEEAGAYKALIEDFELTHEDLARRVGKSRAAVSNALRLFQLPPSVQRLVHDRLLSAGHARALLGTPDRDAQLRLAEEAVEHELSVRALEDAVRHLMSSAPVDNLGEGTSATPAPSTPPPARAPGSSSLRPPGVLELEELLAERLNTRVRVDMSAKRGRVVIDFATLEDLERIYRIVIGEASTHES